jgi:hypothetical protein
MQFSERIG